MGGGSNVPAVPMIRKFTVSPDAAAAAVAEVPANYALCHLSADINDQENHAFGVCQNPDVCPNLLLLLHGASVCQTAETVAAVENLCLAFRQVGIDVTVKELDSLLSPLNGKKQQEDDIWNIKLSELNKVQADLQRIMEDIHATQRQRNELRTDIIGKGFVKLDLDDGSTSMQPELALVGKHNNDAKISKGFPLYEENFLSAARTFMANSQLRVIAELDYKDLFQPSGVISSVEFDGDEQFLAVAAVPKQIKLFDFSAVMKEPADKHYPVAEMSSSNKPSCLSWNKSKKNQVGCSDYEGTITLWDVATCQSVMEFSEHEKRIWSIDFSVTEPSMLASGGDGCKVKIWSTNQERSVLNINFKANVCSVKYSPDSSNYLAVGCADHNIHYYDLRNIKKPLHVFQGHEKAVSYVKFSSATQLVSSSIDSTLRLWDINNHTLIRTFKGHLNRKNFAGLSASGDYVACGSETNEVVVYHKDLCRPVAWYEFAVAEAAGGGGNGKGDPGFVSAVCWKGNSTTTMVAANSQGAIRVLSLGPN